MDAVPPIPTPDRGPTPPASDTAAPGLVPEVTIAEASAILSTGRKGIRELMDQGVIRFRPKLPGRLRPEYLLDRDSVLAVRNGHRTVVAGSKSGRSRQARPARLHPDRAPPGRINLRG